MSLVPYTITYESITVVWEGETHTVSRGDPNFDTLRTALLVENWEGVEDNLTIPIAIKTWAGGKFSVEDGSIQYDGEPIPTSISKRIILMASGGESPEPLLLFWERLQENPSFRSVQQLWPFLDHKGIPLTDDGHFLAYKAVRSDYKDIHTGKIDNSPGSVHEMPRNKISDDPQQACHEGFHVGALGYAETFGGATSIIIICKVDPKDVVCVPYDSYQRKMRVCRYEVIGNYGDRLPSTTFREEPPTEDDYEEDDYEEDDWEEDDFDLTVVEGDPAAVEEDDEDDGEEVEAADIAESSPTNLRGLGGVPRQYRPGSKQESALEAPPDFEEMDKADIFGLAKYSLGDLRKYAAGHLKIVGASKIPGGKTVLLQKITTTRGKTNG